jgi:mRNA-degrading endonuclease toxin of MazEF toxin-antitoxin module
MGLKFFAPCARVAGIMDTNDTKDFTGWIKLKIKLHFTGHICAIKDGDIWWCAMGENVGTEINGKSKTFARPVLVIRKLSRYSFIGVPLTSQKHEGSWYSSFEFQNKRQVAVLAQVRNFSVSRLYRKMGVVPESDLELVRNGLASLILGKNNP